MALTVEQQRFLADYKRTHRDKCAGLSDAEIISILIQNNILVLTEDQKQSLFLKDSVKYDSTGLAIEHTGKSKKPDKKEIYLQSGRKIVYYKDNQNKQIYEYYSADGVQLNEAYFKKVEGEISISEDGKSYTVKKDGKQSTLKKLKRLHKVQEMNNLLN